MPLLFRRSAVTWPSSSVVTPYHAPIGARAVPVGVGGPARPVGRVVEGDQRRPIRSAFPDPTGPQIGWSEVVVCYVPQLVRNASRQPVGAEELQVIQVGEVAQLGRDYPVQLVPCQVQLYQVHQAAERGGYRPT